MTKTPAPAAVPDRAEHQQWLMEITSLPTASGRESRVVEWVHRWANEPSRRRRLSISADAHGNLVIRKRNARSLKPIFFTAHMDHPAFVVVHAEGAREVTADFRGGVGASYFANTPVLHHGSDGAVTRGHVVGRVDDHAPSAGATASSPDNRRKKPENKAVRHEKQYRILLDADATFTPGDVISWDTGAPRVEGGRLFVPACDDLAGVAAALSALDELVVRRHTRGDVRVLLTRAEEIGFVGAIGAARSRTIPRGARVVALEASKSFAESPIGGGPIVRVGDLTSTFDPTLTYLVSRVASRIAQENAAFKWQRKLMPGGTCEATAYQNYGFTATCICLALGNYHNMNESTQRIDAETIALSDYHDLVRLLVAVGESLDDAKLAPPLRKKLEALFTQGKGVLS